MTAVFLPLALIAYTVGVFLASVSAIYRISLPRFGAATMFIVGWTAHAAGVIQLGWSAGRFPLSSGAEYLLFLGLSVMTFHLLVWFVWRVHVADIVLPPLAALAGFGALALLPTGGTPAVAPARGWLLFHTTISTLAMAMLIVALAMSAIYLFQDRALKSRRTLSLLNRLPPLDRCDHIGFQALVVGFFLLTVGIITGFVINSSANGQIWVPEIKQTFPILAWTVFASVLVARVTAGFRGRKSAYLTIAGVMLGLLTVVGMTL